MTSSNGGKLVVSSACPLLIAGRGVDKKEVSAVARNKLSSADGEGFLRAMTDAWRDLEIEEDCRLQLFVVPTSQKGVVNISLTALQEGVEGLTEVIGRYSVTYPSAAVSSLEATLYQSIIRLERIIVDAQRWPAGKG